MQVLCKASNTVSDVRCNVCGRGFLVYFTRTSPQERAMARLDVARALRDHHLGTDDPSAHPEDSFHIPAWSGDPHFSAAALLGLPLDASAK